MYFRLKSLIFCLVFLANCGLPNSTESQLTAFGYTAKAHSCLSEALYHEARGTATEGLEAVGEVIINRAEDPRFPETICGVIDQRYNGSCQFSYRCDSIPDQVFNEPAEYARVQAVALNLLTEEKEDITKGALFFHAASMAPGWFGTLSRRGQFGGNIFYR